MTIWKFVIENFVEQTIPVPMGSRLLTVQAQGKKVCIWALVNPNQSFVPLTVRIIETGDPIDPFTDLTYLGTYQKFDGEYVGHVFYKWG